MPRPLSIELRPFHASDTAFFAGMASDERVTRFIGDGQPWEQQTIQDRVSAALRQDLLDIVGATRWYLATEANESVGIVVSSRKDDGVEVGYWVSPENWGRGIAGAMVDGALASIPKDYGTSQLIARVDQANAASAKLLTRRGFQLSSNHDGLNLYTLA
ncbi:GNAT family N-acetyltransferase [Arthrobacter sp. TMP15]|uniref:GNAT family N-acetyltransferase n=1 Tax=Arthrobacter sp. TMP15 TaxID=3140789 RepID=UPI0031BAF19F